MVNSRLAETPRPELESRARDSLVKSFETQKKYKQTMQKRDSETYQKRFRDFEILLKFSETHVFRGTIRHPL